jgi:hypothetical protein
MTDMDRLLDSLYFLKNGDRYKAAVDLVWLRGKAHTRNVRSVARELIEIHNLEPEVFTAEELQQAKGIY